MPPLAPVKPMPTYSIKIRCFPPRHKLDDWRDPDAEWSWDVGESNETEYARPITDEHGREGVSVKLTVHTDKEYDPSEWDWPAIAMLDANRVEFIRAVQVADDPHILCFACDKLFPESQKWRDFDGDKYCSEECLKNINDHHEDPYRVAPDGTIFNGEEEE